jgi:TetR/AcrR family transcriptional repressor of nem operon
MAVGARVEKMIAITRYQRLMPARDGDWTMRYAPAHKDETRHRILKAAAAAIREHGPHAVGVAHIMRSVGLTHGGFYAHFANKDDLLAQAVGEMFAQAQRRFAKLTHGLAPREALAAYLDAYISEEHRDHPARGCPLTCVAGDLPRVAPPVRDAFDAGLTALVAAVAEQLPETGQPARARAAALLAEMAGAVVLARAVRDPGLSGEILAACRASAQEAAGLKAGLKACLKDCLACEAGLPSLHH